MPYIAVIETEDKKELYDYIDNKLDLLISNESDFYANLANFSSLLGLLLKDINWAGFYLLKDNQLVLGPFWGKPAVSRIEIGKGVCGTAIKSNKNQVVKNVCDFPGHITCDIVSRSEIVIRFIKDEKVIGVLDIDSPKLNRFDIDDERYLSMLLEKLADCSNIIN